MILIFLRHWKDNGIDISGEVKKVSLYDKIEEGGFALKIDQDIKMMHWMITSRN